jgi:hypothetical protein
MPDEEWDLFRRDLEKDPPARLSKKAPVAW